MDLDEIEQLLRALQANQVRYAIFGGAALNFHGIARFTEDIDIFLAPDRDNVERLKKALHSLFDDPEIDQISADDLLGDYPAIQYIPPSGAYHIDLLTRIGSAFTFEDLQIVDMPLGETTAAVVSPRTLYRMKCDTVRLKDRADAALLRERFQIEED